MASRLVVAPLDVIKIRFQTACDAPSSRVSAYKGVLDAAQTIVREEGLLVSRLRARSRDCVVLCRRSGRAIWQPS
jgi:hypothetical protein